MKVRIHSPSKGWLYGYNGGDEWEWAPLREQAWMIPAAKAEKYLERIKMRVPDACITVPQ
jgi:hypothetical protein